MESSKKSLATLLLRQAAVQNRLRELEERKTQILLKGSIEELNEILNAEQPFVMQSFNLERQRTDLQEKLGIEKSDMQRFLEKHEETELIEAFLQMKDAVIKLQKAGELNRRVLQARIDTKKNLMRLFGLNEDVLTYSK